MERKKERRELNYEWHKFKLEEVNKVAVKVKVEQMAE